MPHHCGICKKTYKSPVSYNAHLTRQAHVKNEIKYEIVARNHLDPEKYEQWKLRRDEANTLRDEKNKNN